MTTEGELDRIVRLWLEAGPRTLPEYLLDEVRAGLVTTPQRRAAWRARRVQNMRRPGRFIAVAVIVAALAVVGSLMTRPRDAAPGSVPGPSTRTSPMPSLLAFHEGALAAGRYEVRPFRTTAPRLTIRFTVPNGWAGFGDWALTSPAGTRAPNGIGLAFLTASALFSDPCHWDLRGDGSWPQPGDVPELPTARDLAFGIHYEYEMSGPRSTVGQDVQLAGFAGKRQDLTMPTDIDFAKCDKIAGSATGSYIVWSTPERSGNDLFAQDPGQRWHLWILDVRDSRVIVVVDDYAGTSAENRAAATAIVESIEIEP